MVSCSQIFTVDIGMIPFFVVMRTRRAPVLERLSVAAGRNSRTCRNLLKA